MAGRLGAGVKFEILDVKPWRCKVLMVRRALSAADLLTPCMIANISQI